MEGGLGGERRERGGWPIASRKEGQRDAKKLGGGPGRFYSGTAQRRAMASRDDHDTSRQTTIGGGGGERDVLGWSGMVWDGLWLWRAGVPGVSLLRVWVVGHRHSEIRKSGCRVVVVVVQLGTSQWWMAVVDSGG